MCNDIRETNDRYFPYRLKCEGKQAVPRPTFRHHYKTIGRRTVAIMKTSGSPTVDFFLFDCMTYPGRWTAQQTSHCVGYSSVGGFGQSARVTDVNHGIDGSSRTSVDHGMSRYASLDRRR